MLLSENNAKKEIDTSVFLSVVIPVFNEEEVIDELVARCVAACFLIKKPFEIILVDDGSRDHSFEKLKAAAQRNHDHLVVVFLNRNYGQHAAVMAGLSHARGDVVVTLDADLQNPPEEIPRLVSKMEEGFDVVGSVRVPREDSIFRRFSSFMINKLVQKSTGVMMHDYGCMLRAYRKHIVYAMLQCHERSTFIPILANSFARHTTEIEVKHEKRTRGKSKYSLLKLINLQFDLLTSMTTVPLRFLSIAGGGMALGGMGLGFFLFVMRFVFGSHWAVQGVFTLFAVLFIFIGAQFMALGLVGEYIGRIYHDVRGRPRYFIQEVIDTRKKV